MARKAQQEHKFKTPSAKTPHQKEYIKSIKNNEIVFCQGPAGTGKTHLAIGIGIQMLRHSDNSIKKIIISRPVIGAGEAMGFLPGDIQDKMDPIVRPVFDELDYYASKNDIATWMNAGILEIVPVGYMRGRTFRDSYVICDECQNLDFEQMKMLYSRHGMQAKMVMTGDVAQSDLYGEKRGAFDFACKIFDNMEGVGVIRLSHEDNQRNPLTSKMLERWEKNVVEYKKSGTIR